MTVRLTAVAVLAFLLPEPSFADQPVPQVAFPEGFASGVHYTTVHRGHIREDLYTSEDAIQAAEDGVPFPDGTVITLADYRTGDLYRYVVMEKRLDWGNGPVPADRLGDWRFRQFAPDGTPNDSEDGSRCVSCHRSQADQDYVFTVNEMVAR